MDDPPPDPTPDDQERPRPSTLAPKAFGLLTPHHATKDLASELHALGIPAEAPAADPAHTSLLDRELAAIVEMPPDAPNPLIAPATPAPVTPNDMRAVLQAALAWGESTPGYWRASLPDLAGGSPLAVRWVQVALLAPLVDPGALDSSTARPEPLSILGAYARLRYRLLPYFLHSAHETAEAGIAMLRPPFLGAPSGSAIPAPEAEYQIGRDLLVAPALSDSAEPATRRVSLPPYADWYDWWTGTLHQGEQEVEVAAPLDRLPLFVRAGAALPLADPRLSVGEEPVEIARLLLFAPRDGAIGANIEIPADVMFGVEQERGERKARIFAEGIPPTVRDLEIVGLPADARLLDAASPKMALRPGDGTLPGLGGAWSSVIVSLDVGAYSTGLELGWSAG